ncbi:hypothetical protein [uncultured Limnobacter sp.]|uniref:hypothetical protein n=1 Tax=uncultured Limnobacter sp. TaxID=199681 RepID=UPI0032B26A17|tara:strand:- start:214 stop:1641 length:1428 start_codon:yes stop_codon:yes gene_type:complete
MIIHNLGTGQAFETGRRDGRLFGSATLPAFAFNPPTPPSAPMPTAAPTTQMGLLGADPSRARADAFLRSLGAMAPGLLMAGAPSTDPGQRGKGLAMAFGAQPQAFQQDLARARAENVQNMNLEMARAKAAREKATYQAALKQRQQMLGFAETAATQAEAAGNPEIAAMIRANPEAYIKSVYAQQLETAKAGASNRTTDIKNYEFAKRQFVEGGGLEENFLPFPEWQKTMAFASAANPFDYTPLRGAMIPPVPAKKAPAVLPPAAAVVAAQDATTPGTVKVIPGSPADIKAKALIQKAAGRQKQKERAGLTVIQDLRRALEIVRSNPMATGVPAEVTASLPIVGKQTPAGEAKALVESALSNVGLDTLQTMRENSPTGGALGQVPIQQQKRLEQVLGSLDVGQRTEVVEDNLKRVINIYMDIVYGTPDEIQKLVDKGEISETDAAPLMQRNKLSFDRFGKPLIRKKRNITIKRVGG